MAGLYIHIPFCSKFCTYCNFYSIKQLERTSLFCSTLAKEVLIKKKFYDKYIKGSISTLYIGGGTPSVLSCSELGSIIEETDKSFSLSAVTEFTIEVNPDDITEEYAAFLRSCGINRVSMGIQSFDDNALKWMNRRHDSKMAINAFKILRKCGFDNISLDLIFGYEMLTPQIWKRNLETITTLEPEHISAYQMSIESGSRLAQMEKRGEYRAPSQEICAEEYSTLQESLDKSGYNQYEISNFCKRGDKEYESKHNSSYWNNVPYLGLGPGAHSYTGIYRNNGEIEAKREWNIPNLRQYINREGDFSEYEILEKRDIFNETLMLGLRKTKGCSEVELKRIGADYYKDIERSISRFIAKGMLKREGDYIKIPSEKLFVSDGIIRDLFI